VVPREEADISQLSDELADLLYPGRRPRPFRVGLAFESFAGPRFEQALALARQSPLYREQPGEAGEPAIHSAAFEVPQARLLRDLFDLVRDRAGTEVLIDGRKVPYAHELWLPLVWIFVGAEA
jgi:hypothetical protein